MADTCSTGFNGQKLSKDEPIKVEWQAVAAPPVSNVATPHMQHTVVPEGHLGKNDSFGGSFAKLNRSSYAVY